MSSEFTPNGPLTTRKSSFSSLGSRLKGVIFTSVCLFVCLSVYYLLDYMYCIVLSELETDFDEIFWMVGSLFCPNFHPRNALSSG